MESPASTVDLRNAMRVVQGSATISEHSLFMMQRRPQSSMLERGRHLKNPSRSSARMMASSEAGASTGCFSSLLVQTPSKHMASQINNQAARPQAAVIQGRHSAQYPKVSSGE